MPDIDSTIAEREKTYGDYGQQTAISADLQRVMAPHAQRLDDAQRDALAMICVKIARILNGDANHVDSWHDVGGYAQLIVKRLTPQPKETANVRTDYHSRTQELEQLVEALRNQAVLDKETIDHRTIVREKFIENRDRALRAESELVAAKMKLDEARKRTEEIRRQLEEEIKRLRGANEIWHKRFAELAALTPQLTTKVDVEDEKKHLEWQGRRDASCGLPRDLFDFWQNQRLYDRGYDSVAQKD